MKSLSQQKAIRSFTLIEMMVSISIIAILASLILPHLNSASESGYRTQINSQVKTLIQLSDIRIFDKSLKDLIFLTLPPSQQHDIQAFLPPPGTTTVDVAILNENNNWVQLHSSSSSYFKKLDNFDRRHPFNPEQGHFLFFAALYAMESINKHGLSTLRLYERRKISYDVYDYENEGDGKVSVGFADGHVAVEETELKGLPDSRGVLLIHGSRSYTPGILKQDEF